MELTNLEKGVIALTENQLTHDGLLMEDTETLSTGGASPSPTEQITSTVGRDDLGAPTVPDTDTVPDTIPLDDADPGGGSEQPETFHNTQVQEVAK